MKNLLPTRIICLTEETTEWLYLLGQEARLLPQEVKPLGGFLGEADDAGW